MNDSSNAGNPVMAWPTDAAGELLVGGKPLSRVVAAVGSTPCYLYDRARLTARSDGLRALLPAGVRVHYAMKANPMPALVAHMASLVDGIDVASAGELRVALDAGADPEHVSFAGPGKSDAELVQAQAAGVLVNIESFREIDILARASEATGTPARVALRVNLPFELKASGMKMTGGARQFGIDAEEIPAALRTIGAAGLAFEGFHMFAGSQNLRSAAIVEAQTRSYELAMEWAGLLPAPLRSLNLGGGFGIPYAPNESDLDLAPVVANLAALTARLRGDAPGAHIVIELGRYLVGEAGIYVSRVVDRKHSRGQVFLVVDGGMHHHLAASGNFGQVMRRNYPVMVNGRRGAVETASVVGPLCTPLDLLGDRMELGVAQPGDLVVVFQSGAYGRSASPRAFLGHPDVAEALV
ncbi:pyridoxal-dependent decarboxylase, exosortase A system-associated [Luteimonas sp. MC1572]|uniref:pyridoxal-dependent decarboxylase, exosortase A system-associated n=1 Tax=Luteimonas sp. MC1572 TaxID=2799325 RepID=UPI0018F0A0A3|nr:pyridoxal-dependent decarboxylase, exosortase A system-associated [Luteimonas sp. MC1572]MBJ6982889.1 pyridoxal-dependent decarboxylase, exosortase A system-associated [Luteimonas sp. MC1572]QQO04115.1 pyridoxal-dependent decarboxylase, exosortase A system-associated [Luteimonas sp. MC1572]